jgi:hypothetical protein
MAKAPCGLVGIFPLRAIIRYKLSGENIIPNFLG